MILVNGHYSKPDLTAPVTCPQSAGAPQKWETHTALLTILRHEMGQQKMREGEERAGTN